MVFEMLLLLLLTWSMMTSSTKTHNKKQQLLRIGRKVVGISGYRYPLHHLEEDASGGYSKVVMVKGEMPRVILRMRRPRDEVESGREEYYSENCLILVYLHEVSHLLSPPGHGAPFMEVENRLRNVAIAAGILPQNSGIDGDYPCYR